MQILGNILWIVLGGIFVFIFYCLVALVLCLTIVGIPFGVQCFKLAAMALLPFGREVRDKERSTGLLAVTMNIFWLLFFGVEIAVSHLVLALVFAITIIGIPFARQHVKLAALALVPFGKEIVPIPVTGNR